MGISFPPVAALTAAGANPNLKGLTQQGVDHQPQGTFHQVLGDTTSKPDKISDAAKQFEALIIGQVLKAARASSDGGWLGTGGDQTGDLAVEMAEQGLAQGLAAQGGLGIAKMVTANLRRGEAKVANSEPENPGLRAHPSKGSDR
jgi:Rod binding domain-containing protein